MKKSISLYLLLCACFSLSAFNYQTVYSHRTALFANSTNVIRSLRIDSTKFIGDSILYPLKNIQELDANCFTPYGASWLGTKIIVNENWNYFFNEINDTIKIKTDATLNEEWTVYQKGDISVWATVQKVEQLSFLGLTDSVKTITFWGAVLTSSTKQGDKSKSESTAFDGKTILLSKHYGLINAFSFLYFPNQDIHTKYFTGRWEDNNLVGLTNPKVGIQNLTWFDVYGFQVGDELHNLYEFTPPLMSPTLIVSEMKVISKYLNRKNFQDSIVYQIDRELSIVNKFGTNITSIDHKHDTIVSVIKLFPLFDKLPSEPVISDNNAFAYTMSEGVNVSKTQPSYYDEITHSDDGCWRGLPADGCFPINTYIKGLGGPYSFCSGFMGDSEENKLVYYKKGSTTWGTPLALTGINQPQVKADVFVFPNPTTGSISINLELFTEPCTLEFIDLRGVVILKTELNANRNSVNIGNFSKGLYMYRLTNNGKLLKSGKIVKL